jgi:RHS repeat-associated protein
LKQSATYNNRLQPNVLSVEDLNPAATLMSFTYDFDLDPSPTVVQNNGNVRQVADALNSLRTQTFTYDQLNRLDYASTPEWWQDFDYDIWANRTAQTMTSGTQCPQPQLSVNNMNRITNAGFSYDAPGNLIAEPGRTYQYDAENHMTSVNSGAIGSYVYDASGRRVKKVASGVTTEYLYSPGGNVLAELQGGTIWTVGYIYLNGQLLAQYKDATTHFFHRDHLGSTRVLTKVDQSIHDSMEFLPYGEQVAGDTGSTRKFTGQERDGEANLDYFIARQYAYTLGRFLQPDDHVPSLTNPQSLNKYSYTFNNPLRMVDLDGRFPTPAHIDWTTVALRSLGFSNAREFSGVVNTRVDAFFGGFFRHNHLHALSGDSAFAVARGTLLDIATDSSNPGRSAVALVLGFHLVQDRIAHIGLEGLLQHVLRFNPLVADSVDWDANPNSVLGELAVESTNRFLNDFKARLVAESGEQGAQDVLLKMQTAADQLSEEQIKEIIKAISRTIRLEMAHSEKSGALYDYQFGVTVTIDGVEMPRFDNSRVPRR